MSEIWKNPLAPWRGDAEPQEAPSEAYSDPGEVWRAKRQSHTKLYKVGRLRYYHKWRGHGAKTWTRTRYWPTRRRVLDIRGEYNPKILRREKTIVDKRPIWWLLSFIAIAVAPFLAPKDLQSTLISAGTVFLIYAAINLCWTLILGTAGIFSLATMAVVGAAAYGAASMSVFYGWPWWTLPFVGGGIGFVFGVVIALPATRLDGFYYALLTLGLNELCRVYVVQSRTFGSATGGVYGADSFIPTGASQRVELIIGYFASFALMLSALALFRFVNGKRLGRILRMAPEKREAFAQAVGIDYRTARIQVFIISSVGLGVIGGFYASYFHGASPSLFSFDSVLLGLAMLVIGGLGKAEGAVLGTFIVIVIDKVFLQLGPIRLILVGAIMLGVVLLLKNGLFGIKHQFRDWRDKKKSENRSTRAEKGGEMLPEEATEAGDKDLIYAQRFDKMQRDYLKGVVSEKLVEEHARNPLGQHSEPLERLLLYFRRQPQVDKYAIAVIEPFKAYRIVALSGHRGVAPRVVEEKTYPSEREAYHGVFLRRVQDLLES
ncbi:branched-chain amino acid ABC transporter permease [Beijerinckia sp. L45]|uniref:branched-chain amino acid ABC transporter permease n=1 Tax=Beijerinckia sp. L45 TaxID=1641855 RepID=UPI00131D7242|nr:branched-chain amino acid ABC transporter permease [Beijerinckia sp. L45]